MQLELQEPRDSTGRLIFAAVEDVVFTYATMGETLAIRHGLLLALQWGCTDLEIESDNLEVVQRLQDSSSFDDDIWLNDVLMDIRSCISPTCRIVFKYVPRTTNLVAHWIARKAYPGSGCFGGMVLHLF